MGLLLTELCPADPAIVTAKMGRAKVAVIVGLLAATVTVHVRAVPQLWRFHPVKIDVAAGVAVSIT